ncbi:MAG: hypothetical protein ACTSU5_17655 [Promethearchaeota archaeon]
MYYQCPKCGSFGPPSVVRRYVPVICKCRHCGYEAEERAFTQVGEPPAMSHA